MSKEECFIKEYIELCKKHKLQMQSEDPYCGLETAQYDGSECFIINCKKYE